MLFIRSTTVIPSEVLHPRLAVTQLRIHPEDANGIGVVDGEKVELRINGRVEEIRVRVDDAGVKSTLLLSRSQDVVISGPVYAKVKPLGKRE